MIADPHHRIDRLPRGKPRNAEEIKIPAEHRIGKKILIGPDHHLVRLRPDLLYEHRNTHGKAEALPLSDRVVGDSLVSPQDPALGVHKVSLRRDLPCARAVDVARVVSVRDEADLLRVRFLRHGDAGFPGNVPHFLLGEGPQRHDRAGKLLLREPVEHVALVLRGKRGLLHGEPAVLLADDRGVVAGRDQVCAQGVGHLEHFGPFDGPVAANAGVRCAPIQIFENKRLRHLLFKLRHAVFDIVGDAQEIRDLPRVVDLAAAAVLPAFIDPGPERGSDHLVARQLEQIGAHGAVDTPGESHQNLLHMSTPYLPSKIQYHYSGAGNKSTRGKSAKD